MPTTKTKTRKNRRRWILICAALIVLFIIVFIPVYDLTSSSKVLAPSHLNTSYSGTKVTTFPSNYSIQSSTPMNGIQHSKNLYQTTSIHTNTITPTVSASTQNSYHPTISPTRQTPKISPVKTLPPYNHSMNASERSIFQCDFQKQFQCGNGICMSHKHWCNNVRDCSDGSDELPGCKCLETQFHCKLSGECIPGESYCDGHALCQDLTDEPHNCTCNPKWHIECANHRCLPKSFKCDAINQCGDFSDEVNCTCFGSDYKCKNGMCLPIMKVCNGQPDCADGDDESSDCSM
ncbi:LDL receptor repeat-containing protein egg-2 isoform X3 [Octopus bimaculoides]|uniref:LDL receptor repeat-containing protein egg-2 isoform X3 n=1 Tax=Octopus bimaculoides TaxID=37653 RepID=UPI0022E5C1AE|nr:LDL receptor repeat-containing protein egg-2 isoform X3 [Octopus bimaculoides]